MIQLFLLQDPPMLRIDGDEARHGGRKLALIAYLVLGPTSVTRDELCELLWEPEPGADSSHRLRVLLSSVRSLLPDGLLGTEGRRVFIDRSQVYCDVIQFRDLVSAGRFEEAAQLYSADFLTGGAPAGAPEFDEWSDNQSRALARELSKTLRLLVNELESKGDHSTAARWAARMWDRDRDDDGSALALLANLRMTGEKSAWYRAAVAVRSHYLESRSNLPPDIANEIAQALATKPYALIDGPDEVKPGESINEERVNTLAVMGPASSPRARIIRTPTAFAAGAAFMFFCLATVGFVYFRVIAPTPKAPFGGSGVLVLSMIDGSRRALRFDGPTPSDTVLVLDSAEFTGVIHSRRYSPVSHEMVFDCPNVISHARDVCVRKYPDGPTRRLVNSPRDNIAGWGSPDGKWLLMTSGKDSGDHFNYEAYALDVSNGSTVRLSHDPFQNLAQWASDGRYIALQARRPSGDSLYITSLDLDTVARYGFSTEIGVAWSPTNHSLLVNEPDRLWLIELGYQPKLVTTGLSNILSTSWSPNGNYIAFTGARGEETRLRICDPDNCARYLIDTPDVSDVWWQRDSVPSFVKDVRFDKRFDTASVGESIKLVARARMTNSSKASLQGEVALTFRSLDPQVVWVDSLQWAHSILPGEARIVASAGGFRADTLHLSIRNAPSSSRVITESWSHGIDTLRWKRFGYPQADAIKTSGGFAMINRGDDLYPSGVALRSPVTATHGLTIEWSQNTRLTGDLWQEAWVFLVSQPPDSMSSGKGQPFSYERSILSLQAPIQFGTPPSPKMTFGCAPGGTYFADYPERLRNGDWHQFVMQIHENRTCELFIDRKLIVRTRFGKPVPIRPLWVLFAGQTNNTRILVGNVEITEGIRWAATHDGSAIPIHR